jgi:YesN/AraC family two-component response regulator
MPRGQLILSSWVNSRRRETTLELETDAAWTATFLEPLTFSELIDLIVQPLRRLHSLLTSEPTYAKALSLIPVVDAQNEKSSSERLIVHGTWVRAQTSKETKRRFWAWPATLTEVHDRLGEVVRSWLTLSDELDQSLSMLFSIINEEREMFVENRFLTVVQALEAYHRHHARFPTVVRDEIKHEHLLREIVNSVPEHRKWLQEKLQNSNEPSLRQRIKEIRDYAGEYGGQIADSVTIDRIVKFRNELSHALKPSIEDRARRGGDMRMASEKLILLMRCVLFKEIGFSESEIGPRLEKSEWWRFVAGYRFRRESQ